MRLERSLQMKNNQQLKIEDEESDDSKSQYDQVQYLNGATIEDIL